MQRYFNKTRQIALAGLFLLPSIASAQPTSFAGFVNVVIDLINLAIPVLFGVVFIYLAWKVFDSWILNAGDETKREEGKRYALTAVIVIVVMISAWGIVLMIRQSLLGI